MLVFVKDKKMCKGLSCAMTELDVYWLENSNSHQAIKDTFKLKDFNTGIKELLIVEVYPRGKKFMSTDEKDWEIKFENNPQWFDLHRETARVYNWLFNVALPVYKRLGVIAELDLSCLGYSELPDFEDIIVMALDCSNNQLTTLSAPKATELCCSNNQLTTLSAPNVTYLDCSNNQLATLSAPEATYLHCYNNQLATLSAPEATELDCSNNQLTTLSAPKATELCCYNNQLTTLSAPKATYLDCSNNQLATLSAPKATYLHCYNNQLTTLSAPKATTLDCYNNPDLKR